VKLLTRTGLDWAYKYPSVVAGMESLEVETAYIDGELAGVDANGLPNFALTQQASDGAKDIALVFYGFDLSAREWQRHRQPAVARAQGATGPEGGGRSGCPKTRFERWIRRYGILP
jgi:ATP-dependent DNA ligase